MQYRYFRDLIQFDELTLMNNKDDPRKLADLIDTQLEIARMCFVDFCNRELDAVVAEPRK